MALFTVRGRIEQFGDAWNVRVQNAEEQQQFWEREQIDTRRIWAGDNPPKVTISKQEFVSQCRLGDEVEYVIQTTTRNTQQGTRRGIKGISIRIISQP